MVISIDLDGVIFNFVKGFGDFLERLGFSVPADRKVTQWNFLDWNIPEVANYLNIFILNSGYRYLDLHEEYSPEIIKDLKAKGHSVIFNSSRGATYLKQKDYDNYYKAWSDTHYCLRNWGIDFKKQDLIFPISKDSVDFDLHVDDDIKTVKSLTKGRVLLYNQPYNENEQWDDRVFSLASIYKYI